MLKVKKRGKYISLYNRQTRMSLDFSLSHIPENTEKFTQQFQSSIQHENKCSIIICDGSETIKKTCKLHQYNKDLIIQLFCLLHCSNKQANRDWIKHNLYCKRIFTYVIALATKKK